MITPQIPIIAPPTLLKDNFSLGISKGAINIVSSEVFAFKIEANPPVTVCCPYAISRKGKTLFSIAIINKLKIKLALRVTLTCFVSKINKRSIAAKVTLKYTIKNGLNISKRSSTKKKLDPHKVPKQIIINQSLLFIY